MKSVIVFVSMVILGTFGMVVFTYSGILDVAATSNESDIFTWMLENTRKHSIRSRSEEIVVPQLSGDDRLETGGAAYHEMCSGCHGEPGKEPFIGAADMNPSPPDLQRIADDRSPQELFWVVKNGIRMTGMPAWGASHDDEEIWALVAFIKHLPDLSPDAYRKLIETAKADGHAHTHGHEEASETEGHNGHGHEENDHPH